MRDKRLIPICDNHPTGQPGKRVDNERNRVPGKVAGQPAAKPVNQVTARTKAKAKGINVTALNSNLAPCRRLVLLQGGSGNHFERRGFRFTVLKAC